MWYETFSISTYRADEVRTHIFSPAWLKMIAVSGFMVVSATVAADPPRYRIIIIDPPNGVSTVDDFPEPYMGINNRGEVVSTVRENQVNFPFVWLPSRNVNYNDSNGLGPGTHSLPVEAQDFQVREINVNGLAVGRGSVPEEGTSAYLWNLQLDLSECGSMLEVFLGEGMHKEEATDINDDDPPVIAGGGWTTLPPELNSRGFREVLGQPAEQLGLVLSSHFLGLATSISDSGAAIGYTQGNGFPFCGEEQDSFRSATWPSNASTAANLSTLGTSQAEAVSFPRGINNASPNMIVGFGDDPNDQSLPCRQRALFWEDASAEPIALPYLSGFTPDAMQAYSIANPFAGNSIEVVGRSEVANAAILWRRVDDSWEAIDLNSTSPCGGTAWANLSHAYDINSCGWIVGHGTLTDNSLRAFVLIPADACPGDLVGSEISVPDGKVSVNDLLYVISKWSLSDCTADVNGDAAVNVSDLLAVIMNWGACSCFPTQTAPSSLAQELDQAGLSQSDWNEFLSIMGNGTAAEKENYNCWMQRYLSGCTTCGSCPGKDPFED